MGLFNWAKNKSARVVGFQRIKEDSILIYDAFKKIEDQNNEDPEQRLSKLDKQALVEKKKNYLNFCKLGLFAFGIIFVFVIYSLFKQNYLAAMSSFIVSLIPLIQAVKYHYWYTMLDQKKLLTVKDYFDNFKTEMK